MKFATLFTGFLFALPVVLGAAVPDAATSQLTKRDGEVQLEARQASSIAQSAANLIDTILGQIEADNLGRGEFTQRTVAEGHAQWPEYNWVICHTDHTTHFDGVQGEQWGHYHREYDIQIGGTIGYEIYWFGSGRFERHGDGGYLNWAYIGRVVSTENDGATVIFE